MSEPSLSGIHHLTLNVRDLEQSAQWYADVLGLERLRTFDHAGFHRVILRHPTAQFTIGLNRFDEPDGDGEFNERHTAGLDHFALLVPDRDTLDAWVVRFEQLGVAHSEVHPAAAPGSFLVAFRDPDNIQIEVFSLPSG